ncbi:hypothetical protein ABH931_004198 [Streptacidiphilus sp. MAP12-33]|uniref:hypothetical protein n=1 Tax=Streptacidiphilus sp. MAP12-33 TaxID=3156266 RepID=UPI0035140A4C
MTTATLAPRPATRGGLRPRGLGWLIWRQNRITLAVLTVGCAALIAYLLHERSALDTVVARMNALHCDPDNLSSTACAQADSARYGIAESWHQAVSATLLLPGIFGAVLAAQPLATDFERRRHLMLWSQSVSPRSWFTYRMALPGAALLVLSTVLSVVVRWGGFWSHPGFGLSSWESPEDFFAVVPVFPALVLATFALGALVGLLLHRPIPALGVTVVLYVALVWALDKLRPHLMPTFSMVGGTNATGMPGNAWVVDDGIVLNGRWVGYGQCPGRDCSNAQWWMRYHTVAQFSPMLWIMTGILAVLTVLLVLASYRRLRALTR